MRLYRHFTGLDDDARGSAVAIGNFDGIHLGHQTVIGHAQAAARRLDAPSAVLTFEPHPRSFFRPADPPFRLTPLRPKTHMLETLGLDLLFVLHFDRSMANRPAEEFVREILIAGLGARHVVVGSDFCFGKGRGGDAALLERMGAEAGFGVDAVPPVIAPDGEPYSSTRIRNHLREGRSGDAARLLGRDWVLEGRIEHGDERGRTIGFPTANLFLEEYVRPARGVYAVRAGVDAVGADGHPTTTWHDAVANLGVRPTVDGQTETLEVHLFDFERDLYGTNLRVAFVEYLRPEKKFDGLDALKAQIAGDCERARELLAQRRAAPAASTERDMNLNRP